MNFDPHNYFESIQKIPSHILRVTEIIFTVILSVFLSVALVVPFVRDANIFFLDKIQGLTPLAPNIAMVSIDEKSLNEYGRWPWNREVFGDLIVALNASQPDVIGFDILFLESAEGDEVLKNALEQTTTPIVLASKIENDRVISPVFDIENELVSHGNILHIQDGDGKVRQSILSNSIGDSCYPTFAYEIYRQDVGVDTSTICDEEIQIGSRTIPNQFYFSYSSDAIPRYSFADVVKGMHTKELRNKIVIVGVEALDVKNGISDTLIDYRGLTIPGAQLHAQVINTLIQQTFIRQFNILFIIINLLIVICVFNLILSRIKNYVRVFLFFLVYSIILLTVGLIIFDFGFVFPFVHTFLALVLNLILVILIRLAQQQREREILRKAFSRYVSGPMLDQIIQQRKHLELGGENRNMTIIFTDIRNFTSLSEGKDPQAMIQWLNGYFNFVTRIINERQGAIDKFIGDAVMAFWNAPLPVENHPDQAVMAAVEILNFLNNQFQQDSNNFELKIGIGINTADVIVGNIGSDQHYDYTVIGDGVNLSSRLEQLTKKYKTPILISEYTVQACSQSLPFSFRLIDSVQVKGKEIPVRIYEPYLENDEGIKKEYDTAFRLYTAAKFKEALALLNTQLNDGPSEVLAQRCAELISKPPKDWNGIWKWETK